MYFRAVGMSENPGVLVFFGWHTYGSLDFFPYASPTAQNSPELKIRIRNVAQDTSVYYSVIWIWEFLFYGDWFYFFLNVIVQCAPHNHDSDATIESEHAVNTWFNLTAPISLGQTDIVSIKLNILACIEPIWLFWKCYKNLFFNKVTITTVL